jgi:hypothetical protein
MAMDGMPVRICCLLKGTTSPHDVYLLCVQVLGVQEAEWVQNVCTSLCLISIIMSIITGEAAAATAAAAADATAISTVTSQCIALCVLYPCVDSGVFIAQGPAAIGSHCSQQCNLQHAQQHVAASLRCHTFVPPATGAVYSNKDNWTNFAPMGFNGIFRGASVVFFAYLVRELELMMNLQHACCIRLIFLAVPRVQLSSTGWHMEYQVLVHTVTISMHAAASAW